MKYTSLAAVGAATVLSLAGADFAASSALALHGAGSASTTSANAAVAVPECGGFTQVQAAALGYNTIVRGGFNNINGGPGPDWVMAGAGNDTINTFGGDDFVCGEAGDDVIDSGADNDDVFGNEDNDTIDLGSGLFDFAEGNDGDDEINGEGGPDSIVGDSAPFPLNTDEGEDTLTGGGGADDLFGGGLRRRPRRWRRGRRPVRRRRRGHAQRRQRHRRPDRRCRLRRRQRRRGRRHHLRRRSSRQLPVGCTHATTHGAGGLPAGAARHCVVASACRDPRVSGWGSASGANAIGPSITERPGVGQRETSLNARPRGSRSATPASSSRCQRNCRTSRSSRQGSHVVHRTQDHGHELAVSAGRTTLYTPLADVRRVVLSRTCHQAENGSCIACAFRRGSVSRLPHP